MPLMEWNERLDVGVEDMNDQHQKILNLMNKLFDAYEANHKFEEMKTILDELKDYTIQHFIEEESYMEALALKELILIR